MIFVRYYYYCDVDSMGKWREKKKKRIIITCMVIIVNFENIMDRQERSAHTDPDGTSDLCRIMIRTGCHRRRNGIGTARCFRYNVKLLSKLSIACRTRMTLTCAIQCQLQFRFIKIINYWVKVHAEAYRCV